MRFWLLLARTLGRTLRELLETVDARELSLWEALYAIEPWGDARADMQTALLASVQANVWRGKGKAARPKDFLPDFWSEDRQTPEQMLDAARAFTLQCQAVERLRGADAS